MEWAVAVLLVAGLVFFAGGTVGILRLPDFYTRLHAAGKMDTLALFFITLALALAGIKHFTLAEILTGLKILLIMFFIFLASPTATHAIVDAGLRAGHRHWTKGERGAPTEEDMQPPHQPPRPVPSPAPEKE